MCAGISRCVVLRGVSPCVLFVVVYSVEYVCEVSIGGPCRCLSLLSAYSVLFFLCRLVSDLCYVVLSCVGLSCVESCVVLSRGCCVGLPVEGLMSRVRGVLLW